MRRWVALALAAPLVVSLALARPGGGGSYSGGGGGSKSSGGGSGGGSRSSSGSGGSKSSSGGSKSGGGTSTPSTPPPEAWLVRETSGRDRPDARATSYGTPPPRPDAWPPPNEISGGAIATVLFVFAALTLGFLALVVSLIVWLVRRKTGNGWSTAATTTTAHGRAELDVIRQTDPDFSTALFEDFLYALYAEAHTARGRGALDRLAPYLRPAVRQSLASRGSAPVQSVVIGALRFVGFSARDPARWSVEVEIEANYAEIHGGRERAFWATERWRVSRARTARSRAPDRARTFDCPGCGAPLDKLVGATCGYCNRVTDGGAFDWVVDTVRVVSIEERGPMLTGTTEERGTDLPTVVDPALQQRLAALVAKDPAFRQDVFERRVGLVFQTMQAAWSSLEWDRARPFLSDNLFEAQRYWIDAYRRSGLRNITERTRIQRVQLARIAQDRWFDSITIRLFATGLDYTIRAADNAVVGGNRSRERAYSEYWTLIRGVAATGPARSEPVCPKCGAPFTGTMTATCTHCHAKVNSGEFDWVLARIEQDDSYSG